MKIPRILASLLLIALSGCRRAPAPMRDVSAAAGEVRVNPDLIARGQLRVEPVTATVQPRLLHAFGKASFDQDRLSHVSSPLVGRVVKSLAGAGDQVRAGQTLAVIDSPDLGSASSDFIKARADLVLADHGLRLARELSAEKAVARKDLQRAEDEFVKAKADLRRARERLESLGVAVAELDQPLDRLHVRANFELTAPLAGTVIERNLTLGQMVGGDSDKHLYAIADLSSLWILADVYEKDLSLIRPGDPVSVEALAWPGETFEGRVERVGDTVDATSRTVKLRVVVDNRRRLLKPDMFVTATIRSAGTSTVLSVPLAAVHGEGLGHPYVFVALDGNRFVARPVSLGDKFADHVAVISGLSATNRVATDGSILLKAESAEQSSDSKR